MIGETGVGRGLLEIAAGLMGIALIALILNRARDAGSLVQTAGGTFNNLLRTVTLQNSGTVGGGFNNAPTYWG